MKKTIALILAVVMLMSSACINVFATDSDCIIRVKNATAMPGNTFSVDITVENNPGIQGATLVLTWDSGLTLTENPENGEAFSALEPTFSKNLSSPYTLFWYAQDLDEQDIQDGVIATLKFAVSPDVKDGDELKIGLSYVDGDIFNRNKQSIFPLTQSGVVSVSTYMPGDVDGNGRLNALDLIDLSQYIADGCKTDPESYNVSINPNAGDVDNSGRLNALDLILISQYIADGCKTDPESYNVVLLPSTHDFGHKHTMQTTQYALITALWVEGTKDYVMKADLFTFDGEEIEDVVVATLDGRDVEDILYEIDIIQNVFIDILDDIKSIDNDEDLRFLLLRYFTEYRFDYENEAIHSFNNKYRRLAAVTENEDGEYDITSPLALDDVYASRYHSLEEASFKKGNRIVKDSQGTSVFTMTDETKVVIYDAKKETYTAYEGYADLSTMEKAFVEWIATEDSASKAEVAFFIINDTSRSGEETTLFYAGGDWDKEFDEKKGGVKYYNYTFTAYVLNEDGTLSEEEFTINGTQEVESLFHHCFITAFVDENNELQYNTTSDITVYDDWDYVEVDEMDQLLIYSDSTKANLEATLIDGDIDVIYVVNDDENGLDSYSYEDIETGKSIISFTQEDDILTVIVWKA